jgi:hypothetical protein
MNPYVRIFRLLVAMAIGLAGAFMLNYTLAVMGVGLVQ